MRHLIMSAGPDVPVFVDDDANGGGSGKIHVKRQRVASQDQEEFNITVVNQYDFTPDVLECYGGLVKSSIGVPLNELLTTTTSVTDACELVRAGLCLISKLHSYGFYHLDAKADNIIAYRTESDCGVNAYLDDVVYNLRFVDFEMTFLPRMKMTPLMIDLFNESTSELSDFGFKTYAEYESDKYGYRYDVHTFIVSVQVYCENFVNGRIMSACATILGHVPESVKGYDSGNQVREYYEYLLDSTLPVQSPVEAITTLLSFHFPVSLRSVDWIRDVSCHCTRDDFCHLCLERLSVESECGKTCCPFRLPDLMENYKEEVEDTIMECLHLCNYDDAQFVMCIKYLGGREGDALRLIGELP